MSDKLRDWLSWTSHIQHQDFGIFQSEAGEHMPDSALQQDKRD